MPGKTVGFQLRRLTTFLLEALVIHYQYKEHSFLLGCYGHAQYTKFKDLFYLEQLSASISKNKRPSDQVADMYVALSRIRNLQGLFLTGMFCKEAIKVSAEALKE